MDKDTRITDEVIENSTIGWACTSMVDGEMDITEWSTEEEALAEERRINEYARSVGAQFNAWTTVNRIIASDTHFCAPECDSRVPGHPTS
jgi:hypothetical protein